MSHVLTKTVKSVCFEGECVEFYFFLVKSRTYNRTSNSQNTQLEVHLIDVVLIIWSLYRSSKSQVSHSASGRRVWWPRTSSRPCGVRVTQS